MNEAIKSFLALSGAMEEQIQRQDEAMTIKAVVELAARFDRIGVTRGTFPLVVEPRKREVYTDAAAECLSRLSAIHRILLSLGKENLVVSPDGVEMPAIRRLHNFDNVFSEPMVEARQTELLAQFAKMTPRHNVTVCIPSREFISQEPDPFFIPVDGDGMSRLSGKNADKCRQLVRRVMGKSKDRIPPMSGFRVTDLTHRDLAFSPVEGGVEMTLLSSKSSVPLDPRDRNFKWDDHLLIQQDISVKDGCETPQATYRAFTPTLLIPEGEEGKIKYNRKNGRLVGTGVDWLPLTACPEAWCKKIGAAYQDPPSLYGASREWTRQFMEFLLIKTSGTSQQGHGRDIQSRRFVDGLQDLRSALMVETVDPGFVEGFDAFIADAAAVPNDGTIHWLRPFLRARVGCGGKLSPAEKAGLQEGLEMDDPASFWQVWPTLALHKSPEIPAWDENANIWQRLLVGIWPSVFEEPKIELWRYAADEYDRLESVDIPEVKPEPVEVVDLIGAEKPVEEVTEATGPLMVWREGSVVSWEAGDSSTGKLDLAEVSKENAIAQLSDTFEDAETCYQFYMDEWTSEWTSEPAIEEPAAEPEPEEPVAEPAESQTPFVQKVNAARLQLQKLQGKSTQEVQKLHKKATQALDKAAKSSGNGKRRLVDQLEAGIKLLEEELEERARLAARLAAEEAEAVKLAEVMAAKLEEVEVKAETETEPVTPVVEAIEDTPTPLPETAVVLNGDNWQEELVAEAAPIEEEPTKESLRESTLSLMVEASGFVKDLEMSAEDALELVKMGVVTQDSLIDTDTSDIVLGTGWDKDKVEGIQLRAMELETA